MLSDWVWYLYVLGKNWNNGSCLYKFDPRKQGREMENKIWIKGTGLNSDVTENFNCRPQPDKKNGKYKSLILYQLPAQLKMYQSQTG